MLFVQTRLSFSPNQGLDSGAHHAGEEEEGCDQDVKKGQRGKGHSWWQISVLWDVDVNHKCLQVQKEHIMGKVSLIITIYIL